jgi:hypothetical protein
MATRSFRLGETLPGAARQAVRIARRLSETPRISSRTRVASESNAPRSLIDLVEAIRGFGFLGVLAGSAYLEWQACTWLFTALL